VTVLDTVTNTVSPNEKLNNEVPIVCAPVWLVWVAVSCVWYKFSADVDKYVANARLGAPTNVIVNGPSRGSNGWDTLLPRLFWKFNPSGSALHVYLNVFE